jgi:hypothetical protein
MNAPKRRWVPWSVIGAAVAAAASAQTAPAPRFSGVATTVAVNRANGMVAVLAGGTLAVYPNVSAASPASRIELPGQEPRLLEFCGPTLRYVTHDVQGMAQVFVAITTEGRERLAWPNSGLSDLFPTADSRLTLDGKGLFGFLPLDPAAREYFGLPGDIPTGAGVAVTFRFAGEKLLARASSVFAGVVALSPDDMLLTLGGGGLMRYRSPGGVAWKREGSGGTWRIADVDQAAGTVAAIDGVGAVTVTALEGGQPRGLCALSGTTVADARLLSGGRVLVLSSAPQPRAAILDADSGRPAGEQPAALFARRGLGPVYEAWLAKASSLDGLVETGAGAGAALLVHGADGWYLAPESGDATASSPSP